MKVPKMKRRIVVVLMMVMVLSGCERDNQAPVDGSSEEEEHRPEWQVGRGEQDVEAEDVEMIEDQEVPEEVLFSTWPGRDEHRQVELMWLGGEGEVQLWEAPDRESEQVATIGWEDGEDLIWRESWVRVIAPRALTVENEGIWQGIPYDAEYRELEAEPKEFVLHAGEEIYLYQYDGEGTCFLKVQREIALGDCPNGGTLSVMEEGAELLPEEQQWWIKVSEAQGEGWILVDEAPLEVRVLEERAPHPEKDHGADEF